jgi:hypothetical protein
VGNRPAVQLTPEILAAADLTLCAALSHWQLLKEMGGNAHVWGDYVAARGRSTVPSGEHDLADPVGRGIEAYERCAGCSSSCDAPTAQRTNSSATSSMSRPSFLAPTWSA